MGASVEQLVERAKEGSLSAKDVDAVAARLKASPVDDETYSLLYVISRTRATRHRDVVESFLDHSADPMLARLAVQTLCTFWGEAARYLGVLNRYIAGVEWDGCDDVRDVALSAAGEYLRENRDCELFRTVHLACLGAAAGDVTELAAFGALARALGRPQAGLMSGKYLALSKPELLAEASSWLDEHCQATT